MRTSIDSVTSSVAANPLNAISRDRKRQSIDTQNRMRVQKKRIIDELNRSASEKTNNENLDNNVRTNSRSQTARPSIGKLMYESDDYSRETAIDLSASKEDNSNDDIEVIGAFSAGPSGLSTAFSTAPNRNTEETDDSVKDLTIILDCDVNPDLLTSGLNISVLDMDFDPSDIEIPVTEPNNYDVITIDDGDDNELVASTSSSDADSADDIEIIKVKSLIPPEDDDDVEVLSEILSPTEVIDLMRIHLKNVQDMTKLTFTTLRLIMSKYNWNKEQFSDQFYDLGVQKILDYFKIVISFELKSNTKRRRTRKRPDLQTQSSRGSESSSQPEATDSQEEMKTCLVCFDEANASEMFGSNCGHYLCIECWNAYVSTHVNDRSNDEKICCPGDNCPNVIEDDDLIQIITDQNVKDKYRRLISNSFVKWYPLLSWCPNGDCLHAVRVKVEGSQDIECVCKTVFCFLCGDRWHEPLSCAQHQNWVHKYAQQTVDPKSVKWLTKHTKCCPTCQFPIEKNGGCNYVKCAKCGYQFCYNCLGKCSHGRCLGQNAMDAQMAQALDQRLKDDLQMYPTIKGQYQKQLNQFSIESKLQTDVSNKLEKAVKCPEFRSALKFLKSAFTVLCHCRQTLIYSYVFGYYLLGPPHHKHSYNTNLWNLENNTEYLSHVLQTETAVIQKDVVAQIRRKVQPIYKECETMRSRLVGHIRDNLAANVWQFAAIK